MQAHTDPSLPAIETFFKRRRFRERLRACILGPHLDDLVVWLSGRGSPRGSVYETLRNALRLAEFAKTEGVHDPALLTDDLIDRLLARMVGQARLQKEVRTRTCRVMLFLRERGIATAPPSATVEADLPLVEDYTCYLYDHRGIGKSQVRLHRRHSRAFFEYIEGNDRSVSRLDADKIFRFITAKAPAMSRHQRKSMCAALRSFLRFLHLRGEVSLDLSSAVPVIPSFKLDRLPPVIPLADIERILSVVDRSTPIGRRGYAMLLTLATYGIRAGQLCALRLDDIDWRHETIRIRGAKRGEDNLLPLRTAVGQAIIDYLRHGRPSCGSWREVFLRVRAPIGPLAGVVRNIIKPYARRAGLTDIPLGAHAWRHACATRMLASGRTLKTIRDVLGHQSVETAFIYTKVDIDRLRAAALEWPEATP